MALFALAPIFQLASLMTMLSWVFSLKVMPMYTGLAIGVLVIGLIGYVISSVLHAPRLQTHHA